MSFLGPDCGRDCTSCPGSARGRVCPVLVLPRGNPVPPVAGGGGQGGKGP